MINLVTLYIKNLLCVASAKQIFKSTKSNKPAVRQKLGQRAEREFKDPQSKCYKMLFLKWCCIFFRNEEMINCLHLYFPLLLGNIKNLI